MREYREEGTHARNTKRIRIENTRVCKMFVEHIDKTIQVGDI